MKMRRVPNPSTITPRRGLVALLLALLALSTAPGQEARARDLTLLSPEPGLPITLFGSQTARGLTPFSVPNGEDYTLLSTGGRGFEWRRAQLRWDERGRPELVNDHRRRAFLGMILPGGGSMMSGRRFYGATEFLAAGYLITETLIAGDDAEARSDERDHWRRLVELAQDSATEDLYRGELELAEALLREEQDHESRQALITGGYLGLVALESWWFNRPLSSQVRGQQLRIQVPRLSRGRAVIASMLVPGMGQAYRGQRRAGVYLGLWTYLMQEVHDNYLRKSLKLVRHDLRSDEWAADGLEPDEEQALKGLLNEFRDAEDDLRLFGALAGGLWVTNVMDAFFSRPEGNRTPGRASGLTVLPSPAGHLGLGWTARF